ncbi:toxin-antitoxin system YwqK family antitoxin [Candidatus Marinimicrobia bacterium PRS2]|nr:toxin-antitoxin system YwqK family antitoxin [Candidatus Marinimicrobia bacterium PRS2]
MSKTIKTIQSSEKNEFDRIINSHIENGWELVDGSYSIINDNVYSQVIVNKVLYNTILYHNNGEISCMKNYKEGNNDGKEILYYKNKNIFWVKNYIDGKEDGMFINYYKDGRVFSINHLINDKEQGQYIEYFNNGQKSFEGNYNDGLQHGESKYYYWNGKIHLEQNFNNGIKEGLFIEYYLNGKVKKDFLFSNDIIVSEKYYDENGESLSLKDKPQRDTIFHFGKENFDLDSRLKDYHQFEKFMYYCEKCKLGSHNSEDCFIDK